MHTTTARTLFERASFGKIPPLFFSHNKKAPKISDQRGSAPLTLYHPPSQKSTVYGRWKKTSLTANLLGRAALRGAWTDRDTNDIFAHCSLIFYFLDFKFSKFVCLSEFHPLICFFFKKSFRKKKNIQKTTQNALAPSGRVAGMRTTSSRHHTWRPDFFFFFSMPQVICLVKVRFSGTKLLG